MSTPPSSEVLDNTHCSGCRRPLPDDTTTGFCPSCALKEALNLGENETPAPAASVSGALAGRHFGDYELLDQLGRGGMGVVYRALQKSLKRIVALKMILDTRQNSSQAARRFQIEAETAARLLHPNIVRLYEFSLEEQQPFFTMEWIEGESLSRHIARGDFAARPDLTHAENHQRMVQAVELVVKLARAVQYAHERGVIHRDIKPGNILINREGQPHLTDFGLAKLASDSSNPISDSGSVSGTPAYMAPEQARGERFSAAADIYSLGVVLYELLTGKPPFAAPSPLETLRLITDQEPPDARRMTAGRVDADLATICRKCLEKQPAQRYGSAQETADDLTRWLRHEPIRARPIGPVARLRRWTRRNPVGASFIGALVIGMITTTALMIRLSQEQAVAQRRYDAIRDGILASIERMWSNKDRESEFITSEHLSAFLPTPTPEVNYDAPHTRVTIGVSVTESPIAQAIRYARPLAQLEERMSGIMGERVLIDLKLFKFKTRKVEEVMSGEVDFAAVGPYTYVLAKGFEPQLTPIARNDLSKPAVFFARKGSGITQLNHLVGKSLVLGDVGATISLWAKVQLARAGIMGSALQSWEHLSSKEAFYELMQKVGIRKVGQLRSHSHAAAIEAVLSGHADAGVARRDYVQDFTKRQLQIIHSFQSTPQLWVASPKVVKDQAKVVAAFRSALIESETIEINAGPAKGTVSRLVPAEDSFFNDVRQAITNEVRLFEGPHPVQSLLSTPVGEDEE